MRVHKMTKWDEGQILIKASDCLFDCARELKNTQPQFAEILNEMGLTIGDHFNKFGSHTFGIADHADRDQKPNPQLAIEKLSEVLNYVFSGCRNVHKPIITEVVNTYGVPKVLETPRRGLNAWDEFKNKVRSEMDKLWPNSVLTHLEVWEPEGIYKFKQPEPKINPKKDPNI